MARIALKNGSKIAIDNLEYNIDSVVGDGATCIVYSACYTDHAGHLHSVLLKECYPYADNITRDENILLWADAEMHQKSLSSFKFAYEKLMVMQNTAKLRNSTSHAFDLFEANGTLYSVTDITEGTTFEKDKSKVLPDILKTVLALSKVVDKYHNAGYLHLDIKPSNFLVIPETRELVVLFDMDSVTSIDDIKNGEIKCVPYSKSWAAPEQMQGQIAKLCPATDIYSIGAVLFQKIFGRDVTPADTGVFADWDFDDEMFDGVNPKIRRLLRTIFRKTLFANIKRRYQSVDELIVALEEAVETAEQKNYLISDYIVSDINFVGRKNDLLKLDELFDNGTKAVFLHGFGGVGKTALATKYAELYENKYDCIKFCRYSNGLKQIIDSLEIANASTNNRDEHRKLLKTVLKDTRTLIIIDNFDVENDEELEYLLSLNYNVLFTTRNDYSQYISSEKLEIIELESLPTDALVQVFKNEYGRDITDHEEELIQDIIEKFGNLTLIVPMIAKQILSSHISIEEFASSIEGDVFARFNEDNEDIRIRKDGKSHKTNSLDYLRAMFNIALLSEEHKRVLQYLYLLRYHNDLALTTEKYRQYTGTKNLNILNDLAFKNWITIEHDIFTNEDNITVHQLIYDLVEKDFYPSYESVPSIAKHIENCFYSIKECVSDDDIDWETASRITFAMLMYYDIYKTDSKENRDSKLDSLYVFMYFAFLNNPSKLYKLLHNAPKESTWQNNGWILGQYSYATLADLLPFKLQMENEVTSLCCKLQDGRSIEFATDKEKREFIEWISNDLNLNRSNYSFVLVPFLVMQLYFHNKNEDYDKAQAIIKTIKEIEELLINDDSSSNKKKDAELIQNRLEYYLSVCKSVDYYNTEHTFKKGMEIRNNYEYYVFVFKTLQYAISFVEDSSLHEEYIKEAAKLIVVFEEQYERFAWYRFSENEILTYNPLSSEDVAKNQKLHWSKKADNWYTSVEKALESTNEPYAIYKLLLNFDYQTKVLSNAKISKLLKSKFINTIYNDDRLSAEQKSELLIDNVVSQIHSIKVSRKKTTTFVKKHTPKLQLFFDAISKSAQLMPELNNYVLSSKIVLLLDFMLVLRRLLKKEVFDINEYIEKCISSNNVNYIGELIYFADKIRMAGYIKKSQQIKSMILDLCFEVDLGTLPEDVIQMILFKAKPLAIKFGRNDLIDKIDAIPYTIERKYYLELLLPGHLITLQEQTSIACKFLDEYIEEVAIEAYNQMHNGLPIEHLDEMEQALVEYFDWLLLVAESSEHNYYEPIFGDKTAFDKTIEGGFVRQLCPFWVSQFYSSCNPLVDIGICYLIAQTYDYIPMDDKLACALETVIDYDGSKADYQLPQNDIQEMLDNIVKICPKAKKDIDCYFKNN